MKRKIIDLVIGAFLLLWLFGLPLIDIIPNQQEGIDKFYMDATIEKDGSVLVKELFSLNGNYNGFERIIRSKNLKAPAFNPALEMYGGSALHNASELETIEVKGIPNQQLTFNSIYAEGTDFPENINFYKDDRQKRQDRQYRLYTYSPGEYYYRIYNSSINHLAFYLEYRLKDFAISHDDIAELGWNIFSNELVEDVKEFELLIHIPDNKKELRAWGHGPLNGNIELLDKNTVKVTVSNLKKNTPFDVRLVFDKDVISDSTKTTGVKAFNKILKYEKVQADKANQLRKEARIKYYGTIIFGIVWLLGLILFTVRNYLKYDKEYESKWKGKYYREFPNTYGPETVGYLMNHKIGTNDFSAAIMNLINQKIIVAEKVSSVKKEDYRLSYQPDKVNQTLLKKSDQIILDWLFKKDNTILLSSIKKEAETDYTEFVTFYEDWKDLVTQTAKEQAFFIENHKPRTVYILYCLIGIAVGICAFVVGMPTWIGAGSIILAILGMIYGFAYQKRTVYGNDEYAKWKALKQFLLDFGNFNEKELPEIVLWEKYLVYAVSLGCAEKLAKQMEIKAKEMNAYGIMYPGYNYGDIHLATHLNRSISHEFSSAVNTAISIKSSAESYSSSGSGFGGGFSGGGGSFGGGGGGGRF